MTGGGGGLKTPIPMFSLESMAMKTFELKSKCNARKRQNQKHDDYFLNILLQNLKVHIPNMIIYICREKHNIVPHWMNQEHETVQYISILENMSNFCQVNHRPDSLEKLHCFHKRYLPAITKLICLWQAVVIPVSQGNTMIALHRD